MGEIKICGKSVPIPDDENGSKIVKISLTMAALSILLAIIGLIYGAKFGSLIVGLIISFVIPVIGYLGAKDKNMILVHIFWVICLVRFVVGLLDLFDWFKLTLNLWAILYIILAILILLLNGAGAYFGLKFVGLLK